VAGRASDPIGADLNGLNYPLMRGHRSKIDWEFLWRRYGSASREVDDVSTDFLADDIRSIDTRIGLGAAYRITDRFQLGAAQLLAATVSACPADSLSKHI
jgi:hypothetical protein